MTSFFLLERDVAFTAADAVAVAVAVAAVLAAPARRASAARAASSPPAPTGKTAAIIAAAAAATRAVPAASEEHARLPPMPPPLPPMKVLFFPAANAGGSHGTRVGGDGGAGWWGRRGRVGHRAEWVTELGHRGAQFVRLQHPEQRLRLGCTPRSHAVDVFVVARATAGGSGADADCHRFQLRALPGMPPPWVVLANPLTPWVLNNTFTVG